MVESEKLKKWLPWVVIIVIIAIAAFVIMGARGVGPGTGLLGGMKVTPISPAAPPQVSQAKPSGWQGISGSMPGGGLGMILLLMMLGGGAYWQRGNIGSALSGGADFARRGAGRAGGIFGWIRQVARGGKTEYDVYTLSKRIESEITKLDNLEKELNEPNGYITNASRKEKLRDAIPKLKEVLTNAKDAFVECNNHRWAAIRHRVTDPARAFSEYAQSYFHFARGNSHLMEARYGQAELVNEYYEQLVKDITKIQNKDGDDINLFFAPESGEQAKPYRTLDRKLVPETEKLLETIGDRIQEAQGKLGALIEIDKTLEPLDPNKLYIEEKGKSIKPRTLCYTEVFPDFIRNLKRVFDKDGVSGVKEVIRQTYGGEKLNGAFKNLFEYEEADVKVNIGEGFSLKEGGDVILGQLKAGVERDKGKVNEALDKWANHYNSLFNHDFAVRKLIGYLFTLEQAINSITDESNADTIKANLETRLASPPAKAGEEPKENSMKPFDEYCANVMAIKKGQVGSTDTIAVEGTDKNPLSVLYKAIKRLADARKMLSDSIAHINSQYTAFSQTDTLSDKGVKGRFYNTYYYGAKAFMDFAGHWNDFDNKETGADAKQRKKKKAFLYVEPSKDAKDEHFIKWPELADFVKLTGATPSIADALNAEKTIIVNEKIFLDSKMGTGEKFSPISNYWFAPLGEGLINISSFSRWLGETGVKKAQKYYQKAATRVHINRITDIKTLHAEVSKCEPLLLFVQPLNKTDPEDQQTLTNHVTFYMRAVSDDIKKHGINVAFYDGDPKDLGLSPKEDLPAAILYYDPYNLLGESYKLDEFPPRGIVLRSGKSVGTETAPPTAKQPPQPSGEEKGAIAA